MPITKTEKLDRPRRAERVRPRQSGKTPRKRIAPTITPMRKSQESSGKSHHVQGKSKQQLCLDLLNRTKGASLEELQKITGWQAHTVRGFLSGTIKRKLSKKLQTNKGEGAPRRYRILEASA